MAARMRDDADVKRRNRLTGCLRAPRSAHDVGGKAAYMRDDVHAKQRNSLTV